MTGMSIEEGINQVYGGGAHVVILGAGASIASTIRNSEKNGKMLPSMDNLIEVVGLNDLIQYIPENLYDKNFETLYSNLHSDNSNSKIIKEIEIRINRYFTNMELPDEPTIYDYLVLSLRNKDLIATFNWDPFLFQAWNRNKEYIDNLPDLCFLHGNVAIGYSLKDKARGPIRMQARRNGRVFKPTKLLYPVKQKNYTSDEFINLEWEKVKYYLGKDYITKRVTIFGYGAPDSDVEAIKLLNQAWGTGDDRVMEQFEIINVLPKDELRKKWDNFINTHHYDITDNYFGSSLAYNPRRTFENYFSHNFFRTLKEAFRNDNPIPQDFKTMEELWEWHKPLIEAEERKEAEEK